MPMRRAASSFALSARIALPNHVRFTMSSSATITTTAMTKMTTRDVLSVPIGSAIVPVDQLRVRPELRREEELRQVLQEHATCRARSRAA